MMSVPLFGILEQRPLHSKSIKIEFIFRQPKIIQIGFEYYLIGFDAPASDQIMELVEERALNKDLLANDIASGRVLLLEPGKAIETTKPYWVLFFIRSDFDVLAQLSDFEPYAFDITYDRIGSDREGDLVDVIREGGHRDHLRDMSALVKSGALRRMWAAGVGSKGVVLDFQFNGVGVYGDKRAPMDHYRSTWQFEFALLNSDSRVPTISHATLNFTACWTLSKEVDEKSFKEWASQQFEFYYDGLGFGDIQTNLNFIWDHKYPKVEISIRVDHNRFKMYYRRQPLLGGESDDPDILASIASPRDDVVYLITDKSKFSNGDLKPYNRGLKYVQKLEETRSLVFDFGTSTVAFAFIDAAKALSGTSHEYKPLLSYTITGESSESSSEGHVIDPRMIDGVLARSQVTLEVNSGLPLYGQFKVKGSDIPAEYQLLGYLDYVRQFLKNLSEPVFDYIVNNGKAEIIKESFLALGVVRFFPKQESENYKVIRSSKTSVARSSSLELVFGGTRYKTRQVSGIAEESSGLKYFQSIDVGVIDKPEKKAFLVSAIYQFLENHVYVSGLENGRIVLSHPASMSWSVNNAYAEAAEAVWLTQAARFDLLSPLTEGTGRVKNATITEARAVLSVLSELLEWNGQPRVISVFDVGAGTFDSSSFSLTHAHGVSQDQPDPFEFVTLIAQATGLAGDAFRDALLADLQEEIKAREFADILDTEFFKGPEVLEGAYAGLPFSAAVIEAVIINPAAWYVEGAAKFDDTVVEELSPDGEIPFAVQSNIWLRVPLSGSAESVSGILTGMIKTPPPLGEALQPADFDLGNGNKAPGLWFNVTGNHQRDKAGSRPVAPRTQLLLRVAAEMAVHGVMTAVLRRIPPETAGAALANRRPIEHLIVLSGRGAINPLLKRVVSEAVKATLAVMVPQFGGQPIKTRMGSIAAFLKVRQSNNPVIESWVRQVAGSEPPRWDDPRLVGLLMKTAVVIGGGLPLAIRTSGGDCAWEDGGLEQCVLLGRTAGEGWVLYRLDGVKVGTRLEIEFSGLEVHALRLVPPMLHRLEKHPLAPTLRWVDVDENLLGDLLGDLMGCSLSEGLDILKACAASCGEVRSSGVTKWTLETSVVPFKNGIKQLPALNVRSSDGQTDAVWTLA